MGYLFPNNLLDLINPERISPGTKSRACQKTLAHLMKIGKTRRLLNQIPDQIQELNRFD